MKCLGVAIPVILLVASMKYIEHKATTSPSYKHAISHVCIATSVDCVHEQLLLEKPYLFSLIPITDSEMMQDDELTYAPLEVDTSCELDVPPEFYEPYVQNESEQADALVKLGVTGVEESCVATALDTTPLDTMVDKLKRIYLLKRLIVGNLRKDVVLEYVPNEPYQALALESANQEFGLNSLDEKVVSALLNEVATSVDAELVESELPQQELALISPSEMDENIILISIPNTPQ